MPYEPIVATLGFLHDTERDEVLLIHRGKRTGDAHAGKVNGLGGKLEPGESIAAGMRREILEESGLEVLQMQLRGTVNWPGFGPNGENWLGFIFRVTAWKGATLTASSEGELAWHPLTQLLAHELPMWEGDRHFLPMVFDGDSRPFHAVMPYLDGRPVSWTCERA